jgi:hypothetical protein
MEDRFDFLLRELQRSIDAKLSATQYETAAHAAARSLYSEVLKHIMAGHEVHTEKKGSGAVLKIGAVGPLDGTRFRYARGRHALVAPDDPSYDECELVVVQRIFCKECS